MNKLELMIVAFVLVITNFSTAIGQNAGGGFSKTPTKKWEITKTKFRFEPQTVEAGLQYELGKKVGLRLGADLVYATLEKNKTKKNGKEKNKLITKYIACNLEITNAPTSFTSFVLEANNMRRMTKSKGFTTQFGYGLGIQRNQYKGEREATSLSGRTYGLANINVGMGYTFKHKMAGSAILFSIRKNILLSSNLKLSGTNTPFEISFIHALKK